jgi:uncharacterized protein YbjQ (UPF0145 family)
VTGPEPIDAGPHEAVADPRADMRDAARALAGGAVPASGRMTSDLSIDEELVLHSIGWEPVALVSGVSVHSVPVGVWNWGQGEIAYASAAYVRSFAHATERILEQCSRTGGHGVVGVRVEWAVERHHVDVALTGTAVRPVGAPGGGADPVFVSDLSGRDFALLHNAGWAPLGLAAGASFVYAPRRSMGATMKQTRQNVELTNFTEAMYAAREAAMERMQASAIALGGSGVVEVKVTEGPMEFAHHAVGFTAYGTVVRLVAGEHRHPGARMVLPMDDPVPAFDAASLRGA